MRHLISRDLHAQIAAGDHDAVGRLYDLVDVLDGLVAFDFREEHDVAAAMLVQKRSHLAHARGIANEGRSDEVDALLDAEQQVGAILVGHDRQGQRCAGEVHGFALAEQAGVLHGAMDVAALDAVDGKLDKPVIDQDDRTGRNDIGQTLARLGDHTIAALDARLGERERVARHKLHRLMACQLARADLGAFGIEQDGAGAVHFPANLAQAIHARTLLIMRAVREIEAGDIHTRVDQAFERRLAIDGRAKGAHDLRSLCHAATLPLRFSSHTMENYTAKRLRFIGNRKTPLLH